MNLSKHVLTETVLLALIIAVIIAARVISFAYLSSLASNNPSSTPYPIISGDSVHYAHWADNILALHAYQDVAGVPLRAAPPGYPALLAGFKAVTGSMTPVVVVQTLLTAFAVFLIYKMARTLVPIAYAAVAAFAYGMDPMVILADTTILTDALFSALLVCIVYVAFFSKKPRSVLRWGFVGFFLGIAIMLRPIGEFLVLILPAAYLFHEWMNGERFARSHIKVISVFLLACGLFIVPWMARNERVFGSFEISPLGGHNLLTYDVRGFLAWRALGQTDPVSTLLVLRHANDPVFVEVDHRIAADLSALTPKGADTQSYEGALAVRYILRDPVGYAYFDAVNTLPFFFSSSIAFFSQVAHQLGDNTEFYAPTTLSLLDQLNALRHPHSVSDVLGALWALAPVALELCWWLAVVFFAVLGAMLRRRDFAVLLFVLLVAYFAVLTGPMAMARYRVPAEPYLLALATVGAYEIVRRLQNKLHDTSVCGVEQLRLR